LFLKAFLPLHTRCIPLAFQALAKFSYGNAQTGILGYKLKPGTRTNLPFKNNNLRTLAARHLVSLSGTLPKTTKTQKPLKTSTYAAGTRPALYRVEGQLALPAPKAEKPHHRKGHHG
jgi:hypothetical protein